MLLNNANSETQPTKVCRTCMKQISEDEECSYLDSVETEATRIRYKLENLIPEIYLYLLSDATTCSNCSSAIKSAYKFKQKCLETERYFQSNMQKMGLIAGSITLAEFLHLGHKVADFEVIEIEDNTDDLTQESSNSQELDIMEANEAQKEAETQRIDEDEQPRLEIVDTDSVLFNTDSNAFDEGDTVNGADCQEVVQTQANFDSAMDETSHISKECGPTTAVEPVAHGIIKETKDTTDDVLQKKIYYNCTVCDYRTPYRSNLSSHKKRHTKSSFCERRKHTPCTCYSQNEAMRYECYKCGFTAARKIGLIMHMKIHTRERPYKCKSCDYQTTDKQYMKSHSNLHCKEKLRCNLCDYSTTHKCLLEIHVRSHTGTKPYKCDLCEHRTSYKFTLNLHMLQSHNGTINKNYECNYCAFTCTLKSDFNLHLNGYDSEKLCSYSLYETERCLSPMHSYDRETAYKCDKCPYVAKSLYSLTVHGRTHVADKPYKCSLCSYSTFQNGRLINHKKINEEKILKCQFCTFTTLFKSSLIVHMRIHDRAHPSSF